MASDIATVEGCKMIVDETIKKFGKIDILINNAANGTFSLIREESYIEYFDKETELVLKSAIRMTNLCSAHLIASKGCVVNISSIASERPNSNISGYCISKAALDMFTKCASFELSPHGVRVNSIQ